MQEVHIIVYQIIILALIGLIGFVAGRTHYLPENAGIILSEIVVKVTAPLLIFTTMSKYRFTGKIITDGISIYISGILFIIITYLLAKLASHALQIKGTTSNIYRMQSVFGNVVFLAFPLLSSLYGEKGIIYAVFFNLANDTILWTLGIYLVNKHNITHWQENLKHMVNGNTVAFVAGFICMVTNLQYYVNQYPMVHATYELFYSAFNPLGKSTIYLSMLFIGLIIANIKIKSFTEIMQRYPVFILSFVKLVCIPILAMVILTTFGRLFDSFVISIVVLQLAMPSATIVAALAAQYESDYQFATECVLFSTLFSVFTLPFIVYLLKAFV